MRAAAIKSEAGLWKERHAKSQLHPSEPVTSQGQVLTIEQS
jgi:hypothetical protein